MTDGGRRERVLGRGLDLTRDCGAKSHVWAVCFHTWQQFLKVRHMPSQPVASHFQLLGGLPFMGVVD